MRHATVVVSADIGDRHGDEVVAVLDARSVGVVRLSAASVIGSELSWRPGDGTTVTIGSERWRIDGDSTVWWRRPGMATPLDLDSSERRLVGEEMGAILPGVLAASEVRWVDAPWTLLRARLKVLQLAIAKQLGICIPETLVTGNPTAANKMASQGQLVAKAVSSGRGIAPYVESVPDDQLFRVASCPTMLQRLVPSALDARIVTVGNESFSWTRERRDAEAPDWRAVDPSGSGFAPVDTDPSAGGAQEMAKAMNLSFSVQDWLLSDGTATFLEVNPQGQWLFLDNADQIVAPALAHLLAEPK